ENYKQTLVDLVSELAVREVHFAGKVTSDELARYYQRSNVFVCLSEHEGLCIPLLESMKVGLPIVAYASTAVAETLQSSGIPLRDKRPEVVAEAVNLVITDRTLRNSVVQKQYSRLGTLPMRRPPLAWRRFCSRVESAPCHGRPRDEYESHVLPCGIIRRSAEPRQ